MDSVFLWSILRGALVGVLGAAAADYAAFRSWKSFHDAAVYEWKVAGWRWFQGAVSGAVGSAGLSTFGWS